MDGYREHPSEFDLDTAVQSATVEDVAAAIGSDERRMQVRAYNYWVSLLHGREYPSIEDLEPGNLSDFSNNSVLLDFTAGRDNPATPYIGSAIREECGLGEDVQSTADIPSGSLLSRLTDHYLQIIANRAPVGFEAEFVNQHGAPICYRGILMPFSSNGDTIDFIYGVINWKAAEGTIESIGPADSAYGPQAAEEALDLGPYAIDPIQVQPAHPGWDDGPLADFDEKLQSLSSLGEDAGLGDTLAAARKTAETAKFADGRSRAALYRALGLAYDFALIALRRPDEYAELLETSGLTAQARAPMTPIVKLVFGADYDKTRLTEFASALSYAQRQQVEVGGFEALIEGQTGGLKALVAAERKARRPEPKPHTQAENARKRLRTAPRLWLESLPGDEEFCLVITRRGTSGLHETVARVTDPALIERAIRRCA